MPFSENIPLLFLLIFSGSLFFSALINNILLNFSKNLGTRQSSGVQIRWNPTSKPALGGISFYVVFLISFICIQFILGQTAAYLSDKKTFGILASISIAFIMGLADDAYDTKPLLKFLTQFLCALILLITGTRVQCFESEFLNYSLTIVWVVGMMNSINMLDNMDGITTVVSIMVFGFVSALNIMQGHAFSPLPILAMAMVGTLCGFLIYNWHPSKMFMGDTGSQFLGVFLAIMGIQYCWNIQPFAKDLFPITYASKGILVIASVFVIPISDTATVVINRMSKGKSPFVGGKDHTTHHLFFNGVTEKRVALLYFMLSGIGCLLSYYVIVEKPWSLQKCALYGIYPLVVFLCLFSVTHFKRKKN
jgi:UDP-GlcNAc:undecaprenyl-phosphate GlcNAc-1-phosphate transferase